MQEKDRVDRAVADMKVAGLLRRRPPFGMSINGEGDLVPNMEEQQVINYIQSLITENPDVNNYQITKKVQKEMDEGKMKIRKCKRVYDSTISGIIRRYHLRGV